MKGKKITKNEQRVYVYRINLYEKIREIGRKAHRITHTHTQL